MAGCEEQLNWNLNNQESDLIVVDAIITNEDKNHLIKLTKPYTTQNLSADPVSGAIVSVLYDNVEISASEDPVGSGLYYTDNLVAVTNKVYTLRILYEGNAFTAAATQPPVEPLNELKYHKSTDGLYTLTFKESGEDPNYVEYYIDWQSTGSCSADDSCKVKLIYYDLKNVDIHEQFKPKQEVVEFPVGSIIIRRKYSVSENYKTYLRGILSESYWRGGIFDVVPSNAPTNLSEGATGYFAVSTVLSDTTIVTEIP